MILIAAVLPASVPVGMQFLAGAVRLDLLLAVAAQCGTMGWMLYKLFERLRARGLADGLILVSLVPAYVFLCFATNLLFFAVLYLLRLLR